MGNDYKMLMGYSLTLAMLFLAYSYMLYNGGSESYHEGLWGMNGAISWKPFLFETPFVLLKLAPVFLAFFFIGSFYKAYGNYSVLKEN